LRASSRRSRSGPVLRLVRALRLAGVVTAQVPPSSRTSSSTQLSRAIADTGVPARRGEPYGLATLVVYVLAPVWWLSSATAAYAAAKLELVLAITAVVFPAYGLARLVVPRWYALGAAGAAAAVPALAYSSILVEEPLAYPLATLALWLIARTLVKPSWGRVAAAVAVCAASTWTRTQLAVLFAILALALLWLAWESDAARRWRGEWSRWDWAGAITLGVGAVLGFSAFVGLPTRGGIRPFSTRIESSNTRRGLSERSRSDRVIPMIIGIAALARPKGEPRTPETRSFVITTTAALGAFFWYAGIKGAYVSTVFATYVYERNVIYLAPPLFAATALALARGMGRTWALVVAATATVYVVNAVPIVLQYREAHGHARLREPEPAGPLTRSAMPGRRIHVPSPSRSRFGFCDTAARVQHARRCQWSSPWGMTTRSTAEASGSQQEAQKLARGWANRRPAESSSSWARSPTHEPLVWSSTRFGDVEPRRDSNQGGAPIPPTLDATRYARPGLRPTTHSPRTVSSCRLIGSSQCRPYRHRADRAPEALIGRETVDGSARAAKARGPRTGRRRERRAGLHRSLGVGWRPRLDAVKWEGIVGSAQSGSAPMKRLRFARIDSACPDSWPTASLDAQTSRRVEVATRPRSCQGIDPRIATASSRCPRRKFQPLPRRRLIRGR
jgi:FtsH-binding integral membrane protein